MATLGLIVVMVILAIVEIIFSVVAVCLVMVGLEVIDADKDVGLLVFGLAIFPIIGMVLCNVAFYNIIF